MVQRRHAVPADIQLRSFTGIVTTASHFELRAQQAGIVFRHHYPVEMHLAFDFRSVAWFECTQRRTVRFYTGIAKHR
jgi:hypothetical protein